MYNNKLIPIPCSSIWAFASSDSICNAVPLKSNSVIVFDGFGSYNTHKPFFINSSNII